ncbi:hypothetical protein AA313_de0205024 [Arthrobotrys entomopaga]|nr:hypothetical protein AA313_de0205024 [Arthrobotrys entomopaga]
MKGFFAAVAAVLSSIAIAAPQAEKQYFFDTIPASVDLVWYPCNQTYECARLSVPLNPLDPDNGLCSEIPIIKLPANKEDEYKGIVLTNPGGPGGLGISFILTQGLEISNFTGPGWDIIGFDPRGMGYSSPNGATGFSNFTYSLDRENATYIDPSKLSKRAIRSDHYGLNIPPRPDSWIDSITEMGDQLDELIQLRVNARNQAVPYMTTVHVAYDMLQIAKADARLRGECEDEVLVNYYGVSYGTVLGQTFASLYPQHVGRFVIDSVVDLKDWYEGNALRSAMNHTDEGVSTFFSTCFNAGPEKCSFHTGHNSHAIRDRFNNLMAHFDAPRAIAENWTNATLVTFAQDIIKNIIIFVPYNAILNFPPFADTLTAIEALVQANNLTVEVITDIFNQWSPPPDASVPDRPEYVFETWCSDSFNDNGFTGIDRPVPQYFIDTARSESVSSGERFVEVYAVCSRLHLNPNWHFNGTYGATTRTPVLFVGLLKDPITPYENAELARERHPGSEMIYVNAVGHGITGKRNWCVFDKVRAYFQDLTLPGHDNRCAMEAVPFEYTPPPIAMQKRSVVPSFHRAMARVPYFPF